MRIEVWYDANSLRAFPQVEKETVKDEDGALTFRYGSNKSLVSVNKSKVFFIELMEHVD